MTRTRRPCSSPSRRSSTPAGCATGTRRWPPPPRALPRLSGRTAGHQLAAVALAERLGRGLEVGQGLAGQGGEGLAAGGGVGGPLGEGPVEGTQAELGGQAGGQGGDTALFQGFGRGLGEADVLDRAALP